MFEELSLDHVAEVAARLNEMVREIEARPDAAQQPALSQLSTASAQPDVDWYRQVTRSLEAMHRTLAEPR